MNDYGKVSEWVGQAKKNVRWLIILGIIQIILGVLAVASPAMAGIVVTIFVGACLLAAGIGQVIQALKAGSWGAGLLGALLGVLTAIAGLVLLFRPGISMVTLALILAIYLVAGGIVAAIVSFKIKPHDGWGWVLFHGIVSVILGILIWRQWPVSGLWAIGVMVGVHIMMSGWAMVMLGMSIKRGAGKLRDAVAGER